MQWIQLKDLLAKDDFQLPAEANFKLLDFKFKTSLEWNEFKRRDVVYDKIKTRALFFNPRTRACAVVRASKKSRGA